MPKTLAEDPTEAAMVRQAIREMEAQDRPDETPEPSPEPTGPAEKIAEAIARRKAAAAARREKIIGRLAAGDLGEAEAGKLFDELESMGCDLPSVELAVRARTLDDAAERLEDEASRGHQEAKELGRRQNALGVEMRRARAELTALRERHAESPEDTNDEMLDKLAELAGVCERLRAQSFALDAEATKKTRVAINREQRARNLRSDAQRAAEGRG